MYTLEASLNKKLMSLGSKDNLFSGDTHFEQRREKARIACREFADITYEVKDGKRITMGMMFVRTYGCEL